MIQLFFFKLICVSLPFHYRNPWACVFAWVTFLFPCPFPIVFVFWVVKPFFEPVYIKFATRPVMVVLPAVFLGFGSDKIPPTFLKTKDGTYSTRRYSTV